VSTSTTTRALAEPPSEKTNPTATLEDHAAVWNDRIRRHEHRVVVSLLAMGIRIDEAKEIAQAAWVKLIDKDRNGELEKVELPGLAITQARFLALDQLKMEKTERQWIDPLDEKTVRMATDESPSPEARIAKRQEVERALAVLAECSASAQHVFRLVYEDPTRAHADVAEEVGLSTQRVRQILCEVRKKLRRALEGGAP
jgi:RNA polymerase sigma-70 factor (ECF subfamily)